MAIVPITEHTVLHIYYRCTTWGAVNITSLITGYILPGEPNLTGVDNGEVENGSGQFSCD